MADKILHILQHALGVDHYGRGQQYREHFVTGVGSDDYPHCMAAVQQGLMIRRTGSSISGGSDIFIVTRDGRSYVAEKSPAPPKLTRGQRRYQYWLNVADCFPDWDFGDWVKSKHVREA